MLPSGSVLTRSLNVYLHQEVSDHLCHKIEVVDIKHKKVATADVRVGVRRTVVVDVEQAIVQVLVIVTAHIQTRVRRVEVPVIAGAKNKKTSAMHR